MGWRQSIRSLLGSFWTAMFSDSDTVKAVTEVHALEGGQLEAAVSDMCDALIQTRTRPAYRMPYSVQISYSSMHHAYASIDDVIHGDAAFDDSDSSDRWSAMVIGAPCSPAVLTTAAVNPSVTLLEGFDYTTEGSRIIFNVNPATLGLPYRKITVDGEVVIAYTLFGWDAPAAVPNDAVSGLIDPQLAPYADKAWALHVLGATRFNVKDLLGAVTGSVVCRTAGTVSAVWTEQGIPFLMVGDDIYHSEDGTAARYAEGADVKAGDVLFGSLRYYDGSSLPSAAEAPSVRVMTDAGEMTARNQTITVGTGEYAGYTDGTHNVLPLDGPNAAAYVARCLELSRDPEALYVPVPASVNPFAFIYTVLRSRRGCFLSIGASDCALADRALSYVDKCCPAEAVVTVFSRVSGEQLTASVSGFADVRRAAVSEYETIRFAELAGHAENTL